MIVTTLTETPPERINMIRCQTTTAVTAAENFNNRAKMVLSQRATMIERANQQKEVQRAFGRQVEFPVGIIDAVPQTTRIYTDCR